MTQYSGTFISIIVFVFEGLLGGSLTVGAEKACGFSQIFFFTLNTLPNVPSPRTSTISQSSQDGQLLAQDSTPSSTSIGTFSFARGVCILSQISFSS
ncbi:hypothetical protein FGO68_gene850 [Halteria grandinella]|uniref:Uncharacterized protein n=1 Tax=Halteria grandinella TaxID=5974 RepID=A0A8J8NYR8_HALGN|nr:hypothetical protein FGO68_gene850 [Halteria grandinella]